MTRPEDVQTAVELGAAYVGVVFAPSGRRVTVARAAEVLAPVRGGAAKAVGVFADAPVSDLLSTAGTVGLQVLQFQGPRTPAELAELSARFDGELWLVMRVGRDGWSPPALSGWMGHGILLDTLSSRGLGGTGETFDWRAVSTAANRLREGRRLIVAGGLHAGNVEDVRRALDPDVVDVSSGIESAVGIKDRERMRAFIAAAHSAIHL